MNDLVENLRRDVETLATPVGRRVGNPGHAVARDYLIERLKGLKLLPYRGESFELPYRVAGQDFQNIVGVVPGTERSLRPLLIGAHYDSVIDSYCADDNAAAVAIAISAAEALTASRISRDVVIALFDAEEPPYFQTSSMGSTRFYEDQKLPAGFAAVLIMDLVGHDVTFGGLPLPSERAADLLFVTGAESHSDLATVVRSAVAQAEIPVVATLNDYVGDMSDHHVFRLNDVPFLFLSCGHWEHYHKRSDTPDRLNYAKMGRIRNLLVDWVRNLDGQDLARGVTDTDTVDLEIELLNRAFGPALPVLLPLIGLRRLETRTDLDRLAQVLTGRFGL